MKTTTERALTAAHNEYQKTLTNILIKEAARAHIAGDINAHKLLDIGISFDLVQKEALEYSKGYGKLLYREGASIIQGKKIPWLKEHGAHTREGVFKTIRDGLKEGKPVSEIGGKKLGKGTIAYDLKQIMKAEDSSMVRIARTEVARIQSAGSMTRYKANDVKKFKWLCGGNPCDICAQYCNKIFEINDMPEIPVHPNCTCDKAPIISREKREEIRRKKTIVEKPKKPKGKMTPEDKKEIDKLWDKTKKDGNEHACIIADGKKIYFDGYNKTSVMVNIPEDAKNVIIHHTHPTIKGIDPKGLSTADFKMFFRNSNVKTMTAASEKNLYKVTKTAKTPWDAYGYVEKDFASLTKAQMNKLPASKRKLLSSYNDAVLGANKEIAKKYHCKFETIPI